MCNYLSFVITFTDNDIAFHLIAILLIERQKIHSDIIFIEHYFNFTTNLF